MLINKDCKKSVVHPTKEFVSDTPYTLPTDLHKLLE